MKGCCTDGHLYLTASLNQGVRVVVTEQELAPLPGVTVVRVPKARLALAHISAAFYDHPSRELTLVGITGTNGKTSTTYLLEAILSAAGCRVGVVGTVNYRVGESIWPAPVTTPESLDLQRLLREMRTRGVTHVFLEVSSHALDLRRVDCTAFTAAVFTNLSQDHLDYHRDLDAYFAAKSRLFVEILANGRPSAGLAVLNLDDPRGRELKDAVRVPALTYGLHPESQVRPLSHRFRQDGLEARLTTPAGEVEITSRLVGPFNLANILAAAATALGLGIDPATVARGIAALSGRAGPAGAFRAARGSRRVRGLRPHPRGHHAGLSGPADAEFFPADHGVRLRRRPGPDQAAPHGPGRGGKVSTGHRHQRQSPHRRPPGHYPGNRARSGKLRPGPPSCGRRPKRRSWLPGNPEPPGGYPSGRGPGPARRGGAGGRQGPRKLSDLGDRAPPLRRPRRSGPGPGGVPRLMRATFTTAEILAATGGTLVRQGAWDTFCGVNTDSRTSQTGELFIPLTGERHDGHEFIPMALRRGARGVIVESRILRPAGVGAGLKPAPTVPPEITVIAVRDALTSLGDLAGAWRARFRVPVVGITGSCGKTTTKEMIAATLAPAFRVLKNRLNLNNLIGMPLTLLGLEGTHEAAVVEMGMNAFGEINRLTRISCPTIGVLTNVHTAHTEGVGDIAGVARAKGELIGALDHGAVLIYNADDPWVARLAQDFRGPKLSFGFNAAVRLRAQDGRPGDVTARPPASPTGDRTGP